MQHRPWRMLILVEFFLQNLEHFPNQILDALLFHRFFELQGVQEHFLESRQR